MRRTRSVGSSLVFAGWIAILIASQAHATQRFGPVELSGNLQSQNLIRHPDVQTYQFIQNRNTARIRLDYEWIIGGKFYGKYDIPFIDKSKISLYWRGVYDSVYDFTPGFVARTDIKGRRAYAGLSYKQYAQQVGVLRAVPGQPPESVPLTNRQLGLAGLSRGDRDAMKFENQLRELYVDLKVRNLPLSIRAGRQQIVWGETDNFRMLDRANSLDLSWHFQQEVPGPAFGWDEIRRPFWMVKFLYDLGDIASFSQNYLEWYWNPGDWMPARQAFLPRPWGLPLYDPLQNPVDGTYFGNPCAAASTVIATSGVHRGEAVCNRLLKNTRLFQKGDWSRNPMDNSQVGVRYHSIAPFGLEFTLNYFYQRWSGDDGTNYAQLSAPLARFDGKDPDRLRAITRHGIFPAEFIAPYVHTVGLSGNYSDEAYTQAVFRFETVMDFGIPFYDIGKVTIIDNPALPGVTKKNMWKGMVAFDRPTWIRSLNKKSTFFITGQFFWHYLMDNPECNLKVGNRDVRGAQDIVTATFNDAKQRAGHSCLVGGLDLPSSIRTGGTSSQPAFRDKIRDWEALATLAIFTFYRGGSIVPTLGVAVDPVNQFNFEAFWSLEYVLRDDFIINLAQRYFVTPRGRSSSIYETWGVAGLNAGRSETSLRLTYQF